MSFFCLQSMSASSDQGRARSTGTRALSSLCTSLFQFRGDLARLKENLLTLRLFRRQLYLAGLGRRPQLRQAPQTIARFRASPQAHTVVSRVSAQPRSENVLDPKRLRSRHQSQRVCLRVSVMQVYSLRLTGTSRWKRPQGKNGRAR